MTLVERWEPLIPLRDQTFLPFPPPLLEDLACHAKEHTHTPHQLAENWL